MTKYVVLILLLSSTCLANSIEFLTGGITYHIFVDPNAASQFSNKLSSDGSLIYTPLLGLSYTQSDNTFYTSYKVFGGYNSIGVNMGGGLYSFGVKDDNTQIGIAMGGYFQDGSLFAAKGITMLNSGYFVPLVGFEGNYRVNLGDKKFIKLNNLITPIMLNSILSVGSDF